MPRASGESELEDFYEERFREEFKPAFEAWIATDPLENADAPLTPFAMPEYRLASRAEASPPRRGGRDVGGQGRGATSSASSNYVLAVVLFAIALFFGGMSTTSSVARSAHRDARPRLRLFLATVGWIATFPVSLSV